MLTVSLPRAELERRAAEAHELLGERCVVCPRGCKVDRRADVAGLCAIGRHAIVASYFPHFGEEDCLRGQRGSGTIFFSGCNLRCVFCVAPRSLVATEQGPRPIDEIFSEGLDEIVVGDGRVRRPKGMRVHTVTGDLGRVAKVFEHPYSGDLVRLKPMSAPEVRLTPNHEVFAAHQEALDRLVKIPAGEVTEEHYLVVPKRAAGVVTGLDVARVLAEQPVRRGRRRARRIEHERLREALASRRTSREIAGELGYHPAYVRTLRSRLARGRLEIRATPPLTLQLDRTRWRDEGSHFLVPLLKVEREPYDGPVYNLEVDHPTHSYLAPAVAIGNCQNHDISWEVRGELVTPERLAGMMLELQAIGCHNINWVTPEHVVPQILEALPLAFERGLRLPIVYNTSSYDSVDSLQLMEGIVDVYMPDFKLWTSDAARRYLKRADYPDVARETIVEMNRQVGDLLLDENGMARRGLILRHLIMPGLLDETESILRFVAEELGTGTYVNLMAQYYVSGKVGQNGRYEEIARGIHREEYERALALARELGLRLDPRSVGERRRLVRAV